MRLDFISANSVVLRLKGLLHQHRGLPRVAQMVLLEVADTKEFEYN